MTEPTNIPCGRCGAPMREIATGYLEAEVAMRCAFCGAEERLPRDAEARVLALRALRMERRWSEDAACGPAIAYLRALKDPTWFVTPYVFLALITLAHAIAAPSVWSAYPLGAVAGVTIGAWLAMRRARRQLDATVVPLIRAFPGAPGRPQRCRRCGAELPSHGGAVLTCAYCEAPNLLSRAAAAERTVELAAEIRDAQAYAAGTAAIVRRVGEQVARAFRVAFVVGIVAGVALAAGVVALR